MSTKFTSISIYTTEPAHTRDDPQIENIRAISSNMNLVMIQGRHPQMDNLHHMPVFLLQGPKESSLA